MRQRIFQPVFRLLLAAAGAVCIFTGAGCSTAPQPLSQRSLTANVIYQPGQGAPATRYDVSIGFDNEHFPAANEGFSCAGQPLERITGPSGWVSWTGHYPYDPANPSAAPLACRYQGQGTSFDFSLDPPDRVQIAAPLPGAVIPLDQGTTVQFTVSRASAAVSWTASPTTDVPAQVPADQQPGVSLGTVVGSGTLTVTPAMLHTVRHGSGLLKASALSTLSLPVDPVDKVRAAHVRYRTSAVVLVSWQ